MTMNVVRRASFHFVRRSPLKDVIVRNLVVGMNRVFLVDREQDPYFQFVQSSTPRVILC